MFIVAQNGRQITRLNEVFINAYKYGTIETFNIVHYNGGAMDPNGYSNISSMVDYTTMEQAVEELQALVDAVAEGLSVYKFKPDRGRDQA